MKLVLTKADVEQAIRRLRDSGRKPTLAALHAALNNKGSMSTLVKLKAEVDAAAQQATDSPEALKAFREVWTAARNEERRQQEQAMAELRDNLRDLASENERLEGTVVAAQKRTADLEEAKANTDAELQTLRANVERELSQATAAMRDASVQAANALHELAESRKAHATEVSSLQAELFKAGKTNHDLELSIVRANALLEANGLTSQEPKTPRMAA